MKVLLVEDDPKMAALVRRRLTENGNATDIAPDGEHALWMARAHAYDAIVLDVMLPGRDGFATCAALRESYRRAGADADCPRRRRGPGRGTRCRR